jgi:hypothetical protein
MILINIVAKHEFMLVTCWIVSSPEIDGPHLTPIRTPGLRFYTLSCFQCIHMQSPIENITLQSDLLKYRSKKPRPTLAVGLASLGRLRSDRSNYLGASDGVIVSYDRDLMPDCWVRHYTSGT